MHLLRRGVFFIVLLASLAPARAQADPLLMFLLGVARDMVISHANRPAAREAPTPLVDLDRVYPGTLVEPAHIRRLIDECFTYLSAAQRGEIFDSLNEALLSPKNAAVRAPMIDYFVQSALSMRAAQQRLARLSPQEKRLLAAEFRAEAAGMSQDEQDQLSGVLRKGLLPLPEDLSQLMLAALEER